MTTADAAAIKTIIAQTFYKIITPARPHLSYCAFKAKSLIMDTEGTDSKLVSHFKHSQTSKTYHNKNAIFSQTQQLQKLRR